MVKKTICLIFDGLGDRPIPELGYKTPLEAANTPNFDIIAAKSITGLMHTMGRGSRPGSDVSHLAIFGYPMDLYYTGRGPIEVAGLGVELQEGDVAFRGNLATVDGALNILDRRAGRIRAVDEFAEALDGLEVDGVKVIVKPGTAHRAGVVLRGPGLSSAVSDTDPHEEGKPIYECKPLDGSTEAAFTASIVNKLTRKSYEILDGMDANNKRREAGELPANILMLRGAGVYPSMPKFDSKYGLKSCCIAGGGLYKGIGAFLGMDIIEVEGANAMPDSDIAAKFNRAVELLGEYDFIFCHVKATDSLAEDGDPVGKKDFIEKADKAASVLASLPDEVLLVVAADHSTASELKAHSADPVPVLFCNPSARIDGVVQMGERAFTAGGLGIIEGKDIMPEVMNLMGKLHLLGA